MKVTGTLFKQIFSFILVWFTLTIPVAFSQEEAKCGPTDIVFEILEEAGFNRIAISLDNNTFVISVYKNENDDYMITASGNDDMSCIVNFGTQWEAVLNNKKESY